jgi:hypothetical protein
MAACDFQQKIHVQTIGGGDEQIDPYDRTHRQIIQRNKKNNNVHSLILSIGRIVVVVMMAHHVTSTITLHQFSYHNA